jgi:hypothetical protein
LAVSWTLICSNVLLACEALINLGIVQRYSFVVISVFLVEFSVLVGKQLERKPMAGMWLQGSLEPIRRMRSDDWDSRTVMTNITMENHHRNSEFSHEKW